jgi:hypothetical protein
LRNLGYIEDRNILIEYRWAEGKYERFPALTGVEGRRDLDEIGADKIEAPGKRAARRRPWTTADRRELHQVRPRVVQPLPNRLPPKASQLIEHRDHIALISSPDESFF